MLSTMMIAAAVWQSAAPAPSSVYDRMEAQCAVSTVDLAGQRLARECRAQVRARYEAERQALAGRAVAKADIKTAAR